MLLLLLPKENVSENLSLMLQPDFLLTQLWQTIELKLRKVFYLNTTRRGINPCLGAKSIYLLKLDLRY